jgi:hypothetical protein
VLIIVSKIIIQVTEIPTLGLVRKDIKEKNLLGGLLEDLLGGLLVGLMMWLYRLIKQDSLIIFSQLLIMPNS